MPDADAVLVVPVRNFQLPECVLVLRDNSHVPLVRRVILRIRMALRTYLRPFHDAFRALSTPEVDHAEARGARTTLVGRQRERAGLSEDVADVPRTLREPCTMQTQHERVTLAPVMAESQTCKSDSDERRRTYF